MTFNDRENFIVASVILITNQSMKSVPRDVRTRILGFMRDTMYPSVTDQEWSEIAAGINNHHLDVKVKFSELMKNQTLNKPSDEKAFAELDENIKKSFDDIDFDEIKKAVDVIDDSKIREFWLSMKQMKREYDDGR